jgi:hypothetical protein
LHFAANCGNIIRRYYFAAEYALVAQPVEHLTFNQRARDSSSLERTKIPRRIVRFFVGFSIFWSSAHFCTPAGKPCFSLHCLHSVHRERNLSGRRPSICCRRPFCRLKAPLGLSLLRSAAQTRTLLCKMLVGKSQTLSNLHRPGAGCAMESLNSTKTCWSPDGKKKRQSR